MNPQVHTSPVGALAIPGSKRRRGFAIDARKRAFDLSLILLASTALLPLWLPLVALIALAIRLQDGGPLLYRQTRLGRFGRNFTLLKFRSMEEDAERRTGAVWACGMDPRCTPVGRFLRRYHLDELPQVVNILRGDMSLVGPRPERPELAAAIMRKQPEFALRLAVRPGIAGLAQAFGPAPITPRQKLRYDLLYIRSASLWLDSKLFAACLLRALCGIRGLKARGLRRWHRGIGARMFTRRGRR